MDELTPDVVSTLSGIIGAQTDKLTMGARRYVREFSGVTSVRTQKVFADLLVRYLVSTEMACIPQLL